MAEQANRGMHTLRLGQFRLAEQVQQRFYCTPEAGTTMAEMQAPEFWAHVAQIVSPGAEIVAVPEDLSSYSRFFVVTKGPAALVVKLLEHVSLQGAGVEDDTDDYEIRFEGSIAKHRVYRKSDGQMMVEGISRKAEAQQWIVNHVAGLRPKAA